MLQKELPLLSFHFPKKTLSNTQTKIKTAEFTE